MNAMTAELFPAAEFLKELESISPGASTQALERARGRD
jgi:hypothetical protein